MGFPTKNDLKSTEWISLISLVGILVLTGVCIFIWMAADGLSDKTGVSVAVLFIILAVTQVLFAVLWWRSKQSKDQYHLTQRSCSINKGDEEESKFIEKPGSLTKQE